MRTSVQGLTVRASESDLLGFLQEQGVAMLPALALPSEAMTGSMFHLPPCSQRWRRAAPFLQKTERKMPGGDRRQLRSLGLSPISS